MNTNKLIQKKYKELKYKNYLLEAGNSYAHLTGNQ